MGWKVHLGDTDPQRDVSEPVLWQGDAGGQRIPLRVSLNRADIFPASSDSELERPRGLAGEEPCGLKSPHAQEGEEKKVYEDLVLLLPNG